MFDCFREGFRSEIDGIREAGTFKAGTGDLVAAERRDRRSPG